MAGEAKAVPTADPYGDFPAAISATATQASLDHVMAGLERPTTPAEWLAQVNGLNDIAEAIGRKIRFVAESYLGTHLTADKHDDNYKKVSRAATTVSAFPYKVTRQINSHQNRPGYQAPKKAT